jgi:hypothetical protein
MDWPLGWATADCPGLAAERKRVRAPNWVAAGMQAGRGRGSPWRRRASGTVSAEPGRNRRDGLAEEVPRSGYGGRLVSAIGIIGRNSFSPLSRVRERVWPDGRKPPQ